MWQRDVERKDFSAFPTVYEYVSSLGDEYDPSQILELVTEHLLLLKENFDYYFDDFEPGQDWIRNPFQADVFDTPHSVRDALIDLQSDGDMKLLFEDRSRTQFWCKLLKIEEYKAVAEEAVRFLVFPSTYLCEQGFSSFVDIKSKKRNILLNTDMPMRVALSTRYPRLDLLVSKHQAHSSH